MPPPPSRSRSAPRSTRCGRGSPASGPRSGASSGSRSATASALVLLIKNPAGANEAIRTLVAGGPPAVAVVALNDEIADGRDVSWIWDVDFEPLVPGLERLVASGERAEELALRFKYGGLDPGRIEIVRDVGRALDRGLELVPPGGELAVLPTYTAMLALRGVAATRGLVRPFWERDPAGTDPARQG